MPEEEEYEYEGRTKRRMIGGAIAAVLICSIVYLVASAGQAPSSPKKKESHIVVVDAIPTPTPPPTPEITPPPENIPPPEDQMIVQPTIVDVQPTPEPPSAPEEPSEIIGTNLTGDGGNEYGINSSGGDDNRRRDYKVGGNNPSKYGWYAAKVQNTISSAFLKNATTRKAAFVLNVKIWADRSGRVTRAQLIGSTGRSDIDEIIRSQILTGLQLTDPPPADMPMPINLRMTARKP